MTNYAYIWYNIQAVCILECSDVREIQKGKKYEKKVKKAGCTENESYVIFFQRMQPVRYFY